MNCTIPEDSEYSKCPVIMLVAFFPETPKSDAEARLWLPGDPHVSPPPAEGPESVSGPFPARGRGVGGTGYPLPG